METAADRHKFYRRLQSTQCARAIFNVRENNLCFFSHLSRKKLDVYSTDTTWRAAEGHPMENSFWCCLSNSCLFRFLSMKSLGLVCWYVLLNKLSNYFYSNCDYHLSSTPVSIVQVSKQQKKVHLSSGMRRSQAKQSFSTFICFMFPDLKLSGRYCCGMFHGVSGLRG